jgi:hypothetical protein
MIPWTAGAHVAGHRRQLASISHPAHRIGGRQPLSIVPGGANALKLTANSLVLLPAWPLGTGRPQMLIQAKRAARQRGASEADVIRDAIRSMVGGSAASNRVHAADCLPAAPRSRATPTSTWPASVSDDRRHQRPAGVV